MLPSQSINTKRKDTVRVEKFGSNSNNANTFLVRNDSEDATRTLDAALHLRIIYARAPFGVGRFLKFWNCLSLPPEKKTR